LREKTVHHFSSLPKCPYITGFICIGCAKHRAKWRRGRQWRDGADQAAGSTRKGDQADNARESDGLGAGEKVYSPNLGLLMLGNVRVVGINQYIHVRNDHDGSQSNAWTALNSSKSS
jgi:hypothetical protein